MPACTSPLYCTPWFKKALLRVQSSRINWITFFSFCTFTCEFPLNNLYCGFKSVSFKQQHQNLPWLHLALREFDKKGDCNNSIRNDHVRRRTSCQGTIISKDLQGGYGQAQSPEGFCHIITSMHPHHQHLRQLQLVVIVNKLLFFLATRNVKSSPGWRTEGEQSVEDFLEDLLKNNFRGKSNDFSQESGFHNVPPTRACKRRGANVL